VAKYFCVTAPVGVKKSQKLTLRYLSIQPEAAFVFISQWEQSSDDKK
jgi:hypothetical protein